jgi:hypothetical protein
VIVLSLFLVIVAAVTLIAGFFADGLALIYTSIGACVLAMLFLGGGVLMRRRSEPSEAPATGYGPGAAPARPAAAPSAPVRPSTPAASGRTNLLEDADDDAVVVRSSAPAKKAVAKKAVAKKAVAKKATTAPAASADDTSEIPVVRTGSKTAAAAKKAPAKTSAAKKSTAKKSAAKKSTAKKATATRTTGAAARAILADIKGVGPAKQDALLKAFGSLEDMRSASVEELTAVNGIGETLAGEIKKAL